MHPSKQQATNEKLERGKLERLVFESAFVVPEQFAELREDGTLERLPDERNSLLGT